MSNVRALLALSFIHQVVRVARNFALERGKQEEVMTSRSIAVRARLSFREEMHIGQNGGNHRFTSHCHRRSNFHTGNWSGLPDSCDENQSHDDIFEETMVTKERPKRSKTIICHVSRGTNQG